jgi:hypothetical protein
MHTVYFCGAKYFKKKVDFFYFNFFLFLDRFEVLILKIIFLKKKNIILIHL